VYTVRSVKQRGDQRVIAVDGGFTDNLRPALYGSRYEAWLLRNPRAAGTSPCRVVGIHCESGDVLVSEARLPADVAPGDGIVMPATGAYGYAMASTYNRMPRPPALFLRDDRATVVIRRETDEDLLRLDVAQPEEVSTDDQQRAVAGAA
jgi:diaminopimelate decarboxylase